MHSLICKTEQCSVCVSDLVSYLLIDQYRKNATLGLSDKHAAIYFRCFLFDFDRLDFLWCGVLLGTTFPFSLFVLCGFSDFCSSLWLVTNRRQHTRCPHLGHFAIKYACFPFLLIARFGLLTWTRLRHIKQYAGNTLILFSKYHKQLFIFINTY